MANISREERARREAEAAKLAAQENSAPDIAGEQQAAESTDPNKDVDIAPPVIGVETPPAPPVPKKKPDAPGAFDVDPNDLAHFQAHKLKEEKAKSLDAIEQAVNDAKKIAEDKVRKDPVVAALAEDPGDIEKRQEFLRKFGPANMKPPKPPATPHGIKDEALMRWYARYEPDNFISIYGKGTSVLVKELLASIRRNS